MFGREYRKRSNFLIEENALDLGKIKQIIYFKVINIWFVRLKTLPFFLLMLFWNYWNAYFTFNILRPWYFLCKQNISLMLILLDLYFSSYSSQLPFPFLFFFFFTYTTVSLKILLFPGHISTNCSQCKTSLTNTDVGNKGFTLFSQY